MACSTAPVIMSDVPIAKTHPFFMGAVPMATAYMSLWELCLWQQRTCHYESYGHGISTHAIMRELVKATAHILLWELWTWQQYNWHYDSCAHGNSTPVIITEVFSWQKVYISPSESLPSSTHRSTLDLFICNLKIQLHDVNKSSRLLMFIAHDILVPSETKQPQKATNENKKRHPG